MTKKNLDSTLTPLKKIPYFLKLFMSPDQRLNISKTIATLEAFSSFLESLSSEA